MDRRSFLKGAAATAAAAVPFNAFIARVEAKTKPHGVGYGPIGPVADQTTGLPLLHLPEGFTYLSLGWTGDLMANGLPTPGAHDGMATFKGNGHRIRLVRNHERGTGAPFSGVHYDPGAAGGTTTLIFDTKEGSLLQTTDSLSGTIRNCAGGPTPWGSWMTCEETTDFTTMPHGYIFDVPADEFGDPAPIRDMGRFSHEALAVDPVSGFIYETEDAGGSSGFYRYVPNKRNRPAEGGLLYMLKVARADLANLGASYPTAPHSTWNGCRSSRRITPRTRCRETSSGLRGARKARRHSRDSRAAGTATTRRSTSSQRTAGSARDRSGNTIQRPRRSCCCSSRRARRC